MNIFSHFKALLPRLMARKPGFHRRFHRCRRVDEGGGRRRRVEEGGGGLRVGGGRWRKEKDGARRSKRGDGRVIRGRRGRWLGGRAVKQEGREGRGNGGGGGDRERVRPGMMQKDSISASHLTPPRELLRWRWSSSRGDARSAERSRRCGSCSGMLLPRIDEMRSCPASSCSMEQEEQEQRMWDRWLASGFDMRRGLSKRSRHLTAGMP